jgi:hypothetical protein
MAVFEPREKVNVDINNRAAFRERKGQMPNLHTAGKAPAERVISQCNSLSYLRENQVAWKVTAVLFCNPGLYIGAFHPSY